MSESARHKDMVISLEDHSCKVGETIKSTVADNNQSDNLWREPIIKIISAGEKTLVLLKELISKEAVSAEHLMPNEILPNAKSIICFFIPFQESIVNSNINGKMASVEWGMAYVKTNELIKTINDNIEILMKQSGHKTGKIPATHNFDVEKLISNWSHRHIAYIAGLGTFGINNMLITENGCCGRFGSIITDFEFKELNENDKTGEKCLNKINGSCGVCQGKCITNAYEENKFNRQKCYDQCLKNLEHHKSIGYADMCGKCLVGLPCSTREPAAGSLN